MEDAVKSGLRERRDYMQVVIRCQKAETLFRRGSDHTELLMTSPSNSLSCILEPSSAFLNLKPDTAYMYILILCRQLHNCPPFLSYLMYPSALSTTNSMATSSTPTKSTSFSPNSCE